MRLAVATRSMNDVLYRVSSDLLGLERVCVDNGVCWERYRLTGTDNFGYFRELLRLDADWVINLDEDAFVLDPGRLLGLVRTMEQGGYAACGMPDGGVVPIRRHHPAACNAFFNIFDLRRVRPVWQDWDRVVAGHLARHNLALVYRDLGDLAREEEQWRRIVEEQPGYRPGWRGLGAVLPRRLQALA